MPKKRKSNLSKNTSQTRANKIARLGETPSQAEDRLKNKSLRQARCLSSESKEEAQARLSEQASRQSTIRASESKKKTQARLAAHASRQSTSRAAETKEETQARLAEQASRQSTSRTRETKEETQARLAEHASRQSTSRAAETKEETQARLAEQASRQSTSRAAETKEKTQARLAAQASHKAKLRGSETEDKVQRLEEQRIRRKSSQGQKWSYFFKGAFNYDPKGDYTRHPLIDIGSMNNPCKFCGALKWKSETVGMCCSNGKVNLAPLEEPPDPLKTLLSSVTEASRHFLNNTRKYNSCFQMTSFGADREVHHGGFQPTFIVQGQVYHTIGSLLPLPNQEHMFMQIYFMGGVDNENQTNQRCKFIQGLRRETVDALQRMLHDHNILVKEFKTALENMPDETYRVVIRADRVPSGEHERRFNAPTTNDVAVVIAGNDFGSRDIVLKKHDDSLSRIADTHRFYDALQYPLIFWKGQEGYCFNINQINPSTKVPDASKKVSAMDFYAYHLMLRRDNGNMLLRFRQIFHQFVVDMYVKVESERLRYIRLHQSNLRADSYIHLRDAVLSDGNVNPNDLGQKVILPSTFVNSPRYLAEYTQDAFTNVRNFGRPDLFITFTCNPTWVEITQELMEGQKHVDRHDLNARVFRQKLIKLISVLTQGQLYGETAAFMYSIEWQKRGLPHCHILLWLKNKVQPNQIDQIISAELPDPKKDPVLTEVVIKNMIHGPCGILNPTSPCMKEGKCTKKYPRQLLKETQTNENGYPLYRRRGVKDGGLTTEIKIRKVKEVTVDNGWVVPYTPILAKMFCAHINVECCSSVKAIKYICKYINKGSDQAIFNVQKGEKQPADEVQTFQSGRYVSSNEAVWRLLRLPLHERHPAVVHLAVHLENGERVYFNKKNLQKILENPQQTTLKAFFELCQKDEFAKTLLYNLIPRYYTWQSSTKEWKRLKQGLPVVGWPDVKQGDAIGRVYTVHVSNFDCFCLRMLLHNIKGPTSFQDLKVVNGVAFDTYRDACEALGLLENDNHWKDTLQEAALCKSPLKIRELFSILITSCGLSRGQYLWDEFKDCMSEDILHKHRANNPSIDSIHNEALIDIEDRVLLISGKNVGEYGIRRPVRSSDVRSALLNMQQSYDLNSLQNHVCTAEATLTPKQKCVFQFTLDKIDQNQPALIFLDAPGGTGKTFLLNLLLDKVRSRGNVAVAVASSGIAATLLNGGRTAHSTLKLPLDLARTEHPTCNINKNSDKATMLQQCKLLVWDEATMSHKRATEALDRSLRDLRNDHRLMGGMVVLLAGDFRQTLPVIPRGTPADELNACLKKSHLWPNVEKMCLKTNMRVHLQNDTSAGEFSAELLKIGEGKLKADAHGRVTLTKCNMVQNCNNLIEKVFPNIAKMFKSEEWPKNDTVAEINKLILNLIPGGEKSFTSINTVVNPDESVQYPTEFLNSLELPGTPAHKITLKVGVPVILMRNLDAPRLCNGTRLYVTGIGTNIIEARIMTGSHKGEEVFIPRIPIIPTDLPFNFRRLQFPIKLAFAITINKAQGQTMKVVGVHLQSPCFSHGQLYVACSRVSSANQLFIFAPGGKTENVVYKSALE